MAKQLFLVFQDCYKCGNKEHWAWTQEQRAKDAGYELVKTPFYRTGADELIRKGIKKGYRLPFITDKEHFAYNVAQLIEEIAEEEKKAEAKTKKTARKKTTKKRKTKRTTKKRDDVEPDYIEVGDGVA